jgi:hypothetical protein
MYREVPPLPRMKAFRPSGEKLAVVASLMFRGTVVEVVVVVGADEEDDDDEVDVGVPDEVADVVTVVT